MFWAGIQKISEFLFENFQFLVVKFSIYLKRCVFIMTINYCPFDISLKDVFCSAFYLKWNYFVLIDHILSETFCLFCFCVLFSNMYPKIKFITKNWSHLCNFYSKVIFWKFYLRKYFLFFLAEFKSLVFHNNVVKISEKLNKQNVLKICLQVTYPTNFCIICSHFYYGKKWKYLIFNPSPAEPRYILSLQTV